VLLGLTPTSRILALATGGREVVDSDTTSAFHS
jgi:hypothetical protein